MEHLVFLDIVEHQDLLGSQDIQELEPLVLVELQDILD